MKKNCCLLFIFFAVAFTSEGQAFDTIYTINNEKTPSVYSANKLYYEKNYDTYKHLIYEGLKFNLCFFGTFNYYWPTGKIKEIHKYFIKTPDATDLKLWPWLKNYQVWDANRKEYGYPENWIQPEMNSEISSFFKELEKELICSIPHGEWKYYDKEGKLISTVVYVKGQKVKSY
jgi:hypothetical protein